MYEYESGGRRKLTMPVLFYDMKVYPNPSTYGKEGSR